MVFKAGVISGELGVGGTLPPPRIVHLFHVLLVLSRKLCQARKHFSRMRTNRTVTSDRVANKDEQWLSRREADYGQNDRRRPCRR